MRLFPFERLRLCVALALAVCCVGLTDCSVRSAVPSSSLGSARPTSRPAAAATVAPPVSPHAAKAAPSVPKSPHATPSPTWIELDATSDGPQTIDEALPFVATESGFSCAALSKAITETGLAGATQPLAHLKLSQPQRLWASVGPEPLSPRSSGRSLLVLARADSSDGPRSTIACAADFGLDLPPGDYFIYGATRVSHSYFPQTGPMYRVSRPGDETCPAQLATRGISDWNGDFPISTRAAGDLDGDGAADLAVDYQYAFTNPGTRLLVARPYPDCYRVALDEPATVLPFGTRTHGWSDVVYSYWSLHPVEFLGGRMSVSFAGLYDRKLGRYTPARFQRCVDGFPDEGSDKRQRERLCNQYYRTALQRSADDITDEWLSSTPSQRTAWQTGKLEKQLLDAIDEQGQRFSLEGAVECPRAGKTRRFTVNLKLRSAADSDQTWTRELFVNWELRPRDTDLRLSNVSESSPCPFPDDTADALEFVESWAEHANTVPASLSSVHSTLQRAHARGRLELPSVRGCASEPGTPTWTWSAILLSGKEDAPLRTPLYLLLGRSGEQWQVLGSSQIAPAQCPLH